MACSSTPKAKWEMETGNALEAHEPASLAHTAAKRSLMSVYPRLPSDLMHTGAHFTCTHTYIVYTCIALSKREREKLQDKLATSRTPKPFITMELQILSKPSKTLIHLAKK